MRRILLPLLVLGVLLLSACDTLTVETVEVVEVVGVGGDGQPIVLVDNPSATNPTYDELKAFLYSDTTNLNHYVDGGPVGYICTDFAETVHNNAEVAGIRAAWVSVTFEGETEGHVLNAFETSDEGLVYIDCTSGECTKFWVGDHYTDQHPLSMELPVMPTLPWVTYETDPSAYSAYIRHVKWDTVAYIKVGKKYGIVAVAEAESLQYDFYLGYEQRWQEYESNLSAYNSEVEEYNFEVFKYNMELWGNNWEFNRLTTWSAELDRKEQELDQLKEKCGDYFYELVGISGYVKDVQVAW